VLKTRRQGSPLRDADENVRQLPAKPYWKGWGYNPGSDHTHSVPEEHSGCGSTRGSAKRCIEQSVAWSAVRRHPVLLQPPAPQPMTGMKPTYFGAH